MEVDTVMDDRRWANQPLRQDRLRLVEAALPEMPCLQRAVRQFSWVSVVGDRELKKLDLSIAQQLQDLLAHEAPSSTIVFSPTDMIRELEAYGETEAAEKLIGLSDSQIREIGLLAHAHYSRADDGRGPVLDTAICLGVIEFLEGSPRPLRRKRRVYPGSP